MADSLPGSSAEPPIEMSSAMEVEEIKISDSTSTAWTDEKHSLYLNSMEASFVNQLYSSDYLSKDFLGWYSSKGKHSNSSGSSANSLLPHEFKVQRGGCWTKVKFERAKRRANIENQSHPLSANPWIQHFRSSFGKDPDIIGSKTEKESIITASNQVDDNVRAIQSIHIASPGRRREATNSTQLSANHSHLCCQDSLGCNTGEPGGQRVICEVLLNGDVTGSNLEISEVLSKGEVTGLNPNISNILNKGEITGSNPDKSKKADILQQTCQAQEPIFSLSIPTRESDMGHLLEGVCVLTLVLYKGTSRVRQYFVD